MVLKLHLDIVKISHHTKNEVSRSRHSKVIACTDRQTHRQYENITFPHTRAVNIISLVPILELCSKLGSFVGEETKQFYDDNAELAVNAMLNGDVDMNEPVDAWIKVFTEVKYFQPSAMNCYTEARSS